MARGAVGTGERAEAKEIPGAGVTDPVNPVPWGRGKKRRRRHQRRVDVQRGSGGGGAGGVNNRELKSLQ